MLTQTKQFEQIPFEKYGQGRVGARCVTLRYFFRRHHDPITLASREFKISSSKREIIENKAMVRR